MRRTLIVLAMLAAILGFLMVPGGAVEPAAAHHEDSFCVDGACVPVPHVCLPSPDPHKYQQCIT